MNTERSLGELPLSLGDVAPARQGDLDVLRKAAEKHRCIGIEGLVSVLSRDPAEAQDQLGTIGNMLDGADA